MTTIRKRLITNASVGQPAHRRYMYAGEECISITVPAIMIGGMYDTTYVLESAVKGTQSANGRPILFHDIGEDETALTPEAFLSHRIGEMFNCRKVDASDNWKVELLLVPSWIERTGNSHILEHLTGGGSFDVQLRMNAKCVMVSGRVNDQSYNAAVAGIDVDHALITVSSLKANKLDAPITYSHHKPLLPLTTAAAKGDSVVRDVLIARILAADPSFKRAELQQCPTTALETFAEATALPEWETRMAQFRTSGSRSVATDDDNKGYEFRSLRTTSGGNRTQLIVALSNSGLFKHWFKTGDDLSVLKDSTLNQLAVAADEYARFAADDSLMPIPSMDVAMAQQEMINARLCAKKR